MFKQIRLKPVYSSETDDIVAEFYSPVLREAVSFDRTSAYFSAKALSLYAEGLESFASKGGKYRLIISQDVSEEDYNEIKEGYALKDAVSNTMLQSLDEVLTLKEEKQISNLAYLIATGVVDIKIAFKTPGVFHDKCGIVVDEVGDVICFRGSNNETVAAVYNNYESFQLTCSWLDQDGFYGMGIRESQSEFEALWNNQKEGIKVRSAEGVILRRILNHNKGRIIVEEALLQDETAVLDYDDELVLYLNCDNYEKVINSAFFKMRLKRRVQSINGNVVRFKRSLTYIDYIKINDLLKDKIAPFGVRFITTQRFNEYVEKRNLHIKSRARLGTELKTDASRISMHYDEFKKVVNKGMSRQLRERQMQDAFFMYGMAKSGNFSVPGSGKTSSALGVYRFLKSKDLVDRIVVVGPKNSFDSWRTEFNKCFDGIEELNCFDIHDTSFKNPQERRYALKFESGNNNLFLFNYDILASYITELKHIVSSRTILVFDEVHRVKRIHGSLASQALELASVANYIIVMTGTPIPNSYQDLYNILNILFGDEYKEFFGFDINELKAPDDNKIFEINTKIQPFFCRTTKQDLLVPPANDDLALQIQSSENEQALFDIVSKKYRNNKFALIIRLLQMESNPRLLLEKIDLSEFTDVLDIPDEIDEIDYVDFSSEVERLIKSIDVTTKKHKCLDYTSSLVNDGKSVIIWCIFVDSILDLQMRLEQKGIHAECIYGNIAQEDRERILKEFRNGEFKVLITNPHTLAESVSLHSICHDAIYYEYSYNLVHLLQSKDRIHRLGLPDGQYTQWYFLQNYYKYDHADYSLDANIYDRLKEKEETMLNAIDNNQLEPAYTTEEDLAYVLKGLI